jgi:hypothetical protein
MVLNAYSPTPEASTKSYPADVAITKGTLASAIIGMIACVTGVQSAPIITDTRSCSMRRLVAGTPIAESHALSA